MRHIRDLLVVAGVEGHKEVAGVEVVLVAEKAGDSSSVLRPLYGQRETLPRGFRIKCGMT